MTYCIKHPKYRGKKKPKSRCEGCLVIYFRTNIGRIPTARPTLAFQDRTKYSRKRKHREDYET